MRFKPGKEESGTNFIRDLDGLRSRSGQSTEEKNNCPCQESNSDCPSQCHRHIDLDKSNECLKFAD
jgi:hypothetical protein